MKKLEEPGYRLNPKKCDFFKKKSRFDWTQNRPKRITTLRSQIGSNNKNRNIKKRKGIEDLESGTILVKGYRKTVSTNRYTKKIAEKTKVDVDR